MCDWISVSDRLPDDGQTVEIMYWGECVDNALFEKRRYITRNAFTIEAMAHEACSYCGKTDFMMLGKPYRKLVNPDQWRPTDASDES